MSLPQTEAADPRWEALDGWPVLSVLGALWEGQLAAVAAVGPALPALAGAIEAAVQRLRGNEAGRLIYAGAGSSARLAAGDGAELGPTFDWPEKRLLILPAGGPDALMRAHENAEDETAAVEEAIARHGIGRRDVLVAVAASGRTPFTVRAARVARAEGALVIALANSAGCPLLAGADHPVLLATGSEPIAGSTRLKAGTAQKVALNLLSTAIMVAMGRTYRGRMVEMRATNAKLRERAARMVATLAGVSEAAARAALASADGRPKLALLMLSGLDRIVAEAALAEAGGHLREALARRSGHS